jgi:hypothetical protein
VEQALLEGATANGFIGELWTLDRVALVIQRLTGVQHHPVARFGVTHVLAAVPGDRSDPTLRIPALRRLRHTAGAPGRLGHPHPPAPPGRRPRPAAGGRVLVLQPEFVTWRVRGGQGR